MESAGESLHFGGSALLGSHETQPWEEVMRVEARQPERRASVSSEDSDVEAPPVIARKVSFADAFGLDLVSVKEFDTWNTPTPALSSPSDHSSLQDSEEYCLSSLFAVPSSPEELRRTLQEQKVQLEHVELLPGTTLLRGTIRVLNLCFDKQVYARTTLDKWGSHFDLLTEFVPGSSDGETDRFSFMLSLMPPSEGQRVRVEFCLRYETTMGTFWDNNGGRNYVLFYDRRTARDMKVRLQEEFFQPNKKSCLKTSRDSPADFHLAKIPVEISDATGSDKDVGSAGTQLEEGLQSEGCDWHSTRRSRQKMARLVQLQDHFSRREAEPVRAITPETSAVSVSPSESATPCPPGLCKSNEQAQSRPQATPPLGDADSKNRQAASVPRDPWESFLSIDNTVHATALEMATSSSPFLDLPPSCLQDVISQLDFSSRPPVLMENHERCCARGSDWHPLWGDLEVEIGRVNTKGSDSGRDDRLLGHNPHVESESHGGSCSQTELYKEDADVRGSREQAGAIRGGDSNAQLNSAALPVGHLTEIAVDHFPVSSPMTPVTGFHCPIENDKAGFLLGGRRGANEKDEPADKIQNIAAKEEISLAEADDHLTEKDKIVSCSPEVAVREPIDNLVDISPGELVNHSVKMAVDGIVNQSSEISAAELIGNSAEISAEELVDKLAKISTSELVNRSAEIGADEKIDYSAEITACELADNSAEISAVQLLHHSAEICTDEQGGHSAEISADELVDNSAEITAIEPVHYSAEISVDGLNKDAIKIIPGNITSNQPVGHSDRIHPGQVIDHTVQCYGDHSELRVHTSATPQSATLHLLNTNSVERILLEYKEESMMSPKKDSLVYNRDCHTEMDIVNIPQEDEEKEATRDEGDCERSQANDPDERQQVDAYRLRDIEKVKRGMENASRGKEGGVVTRGRERPHAAREKVVLLHAKGRGFLSTKSKGKGKESSDLFKAGLEDSMDAGQASYVEQNMGVEEGNLYSTAVSLPGNNELRVKDFQRQEEGQPPAGAVEGLPTPASTGCSPGDHMPCILTNEDAEDSQGIAASFHLTLGTQKEPIAVRMSPEERAEAKNMGYMLHLLGIITPHHLSRTVLYVVLLAVLCVAVYQYGFLACFALYLCLACLLSHHREKQHLQERDRTK